MAEFQIKSKDGLVTRATGAPVYNGTYLKPGYLEFAEIASPTPIGWQAGDYVDYPRTGLRYRLYNTPKSRKQGEQNLYGASFVYENVQFFDITKELELAPFADFVPDDNLIHFSTLNSVAFFGTPANVAERVQACLNYWFPSSNWIVRVITGLDPSTDAELIETLSTDAEFSVSGTSCQGALDRLYDTWNGLGYSFSQSGGSNIITIGYPNKRTAANTTSSYGRIDDNGIVTLARSVSNVDEIGTRLYAYGSMRNMPTGYYREKDIKDAESVDIEHLMLPINAVPSLNYGGWGETDNLPDARKAYIENSAAISQLGLIPRYAYFDGSDSNYPEIFPSIVGATIGDVIDGKQATGDTDYVPSLSKWSRDDRIDEIVSATNPSDAGGGSNSGSKYSESGDHSTAAGTIDSSEGETEWELGSYSPSAPSGSAYIVLNVDGEIEIATEDIDKIEVVAKLIAGPGVSGTSIYDIPVEMDMGSESDVHAFTLSNVSANIVSKGITYVRINFVIQREGQEPVDYLATINAGTVFIGFTPYITKTFSVSIPQIGFNLLQYADMGNGKTISMRTGMCAGRDFPITAASYVSSSDTWSLTLSRVKDSDTGLLYPNSDFPIAEGDKYMLLDIAMPELYISMASIRLLKAAQKLLGDIDHEKPFYEPEIDSKRVYNESRVLREGMWMHLVGDEIVDGGEDYSIIDTLQIDEGVSNIPVYSVTLREKKPVEWTESISQSSRTVTSSAVDESATPAQSSGSANLDWFIQESYDDSGSTKYRLKLNPKYQGMYAEGWVSAGGLSDQSGGSTPAGDYLPLAGGTMTGPISMAVTSGNLTVNEAFRFTYNDSVVGSLRAASSGAVGLYANGTIQLRPGGSISSGLVISTTDVTFNGASILGGTYALPTATSEELGGIKIGYEANGNYYPLQLDSYNRAYVYVPWESGSGGGSGGDGGDIDPSVLANYVTINGAETITGAKTFTAQTVLTDTLIVGSGATTLAPSTPGAKKRIYFGDADHYLELNSNGYYFHGAPGVYTNGFMSAGGIGSGGEGGGGGVSGDYLPLAGGRMTGAIRLTTEDNMAGTGSIRAVHISDDQEVLDGYIGYRNNGAMRIHAGGQIYIRPAGKTSGGLNVSGVAARFNDRIIDTYKSLYSSEEETEDYGILVKTTLKSTSECLPTFHITGMDYNGSTIDTFVSFWMGISSSQMNRPSRVSLGTELGVIYAFVYDPDDYTNPTGTGGRVYLWFSRPSRYSTIYVSLYNARNKESENGVESIEYAPMPSNDYIARRTAINPGSTITGSYSAVKISAVEGGVANVNTGVYGNRYGIKIDATGKAYVDIPSGSGGGGSGTTYYAGTGLSLSGSTFNLTKATTDALGGVKAATSSTSTISTTTASSGTYYSVGVDKDGKMYVRIPSTGGTTVSWGTEQNNTVKLTVGGVEKTVCLDGYSSGSSPSGSYLALSGGTMTGTINAQAVIPKTNSTSQSNGYELGSSSYYWRNLYSRRIYLSSNVYIYYDSTNNCIRTNAPIVSDSWIAAGGVSTP